MSENDIELFRKKKVAELKEIAKSLGINKLEGLRKPEIIEKITSFNSKSDTSTNKTKLSVENKSITTTTNTEEKN